MQTPSATIIRILADTGTTSGLTDALTGTTPAWWDSSATRFEIALARGGRMFPDLSTIASVTLEVKDMDGNAAPPASAPARMSQTVSNWTPCTPEQWEAQISQHLVFFFTAEEASIGKGKKWLVISADTFAPGGPFTLDAGQVEVLEDGYHSPGLAPAPDTTAYSKEQADARFAERLNEQFRLNNGMLQLFNHTTKLWQPVSVSADGQSLILGGGVADPGMVPPASAPQSWEVTYNEGDAGDGVQPVHLGDVTMASVAWLNPGATFAVGMHGQAALDEIIQGGGSEGAEYPVLLLRPLDGWTGGTIGVGERVAFVSNAGIQGEQGEQGDQGDPGDTGPANNLTVGTVTTLAAGAAATATLTGASPNQTLNLGLPRGATGENGTTADTARIVALEGVARGEGGQVVISAGTGTGNGMRLTQVLSGRIALFFDTVYTGTENNNLYLFGTEAVGLGGALSFVPAWKGLRLFKSNNGDVADLGNLPAWTSGQALRFCLALDAVSGAYELRPSDGSLAGSGTVPVGMMAEIRYLFANSGGYISALSGHHRRVGALNYWPTAGQVASYFQRGFAAKDRVYAANYLSYAWTNGRTGYQPFAAFSRDGNTLSVGTGANQNGCARVMFGRAYPPGSVFRVKISAVAATSGTVDVGLFSMAAGNNATATIIEGSMAPDGGTISFRAYIRDGMPPADCFYFGMSGSVGTSGHTCTFTVEEIVAEGCILDLTPDNVGTGGDWADGSQSRNHARKQVASTGFVLAGQPRTIAIPVTWPSTSIPAGSEAPVLLTSAEAAAIGSTATTDRFTWTAAAALPAGLAVKEVRCTSAGNVSVIVRNLTAGAISTGAHAGTLFQIIP